MIQQRVARSRLRSSSISFLWLLAPVLATALTAPPAHASLVIALDTNELAKRADHVTVADVVSVQSGWDERHEKIRTTIDLLVVESWKGGAVPASHITIVQPGGTVGDVAMVVFGMSQFVPGERALFFLRGKPAAASVVGMAQGKRPMRREEATGRWMINRADHSGLGRVQMTPPMSSAVTPTPVIDDGAAPQSLDDMRERIRTILKVKQ
jgi:hypothetical protein